MIRGRSPHREPASRPRRSGPAHRPSGAILAASVAAAIAGPGGAGNAVAQEIRGRVVVEGSAGEPVDGALVALLDASGATADAAFSDAAGFFLLEAAAAGTYRVRIERIGFESWTSDPVLLTYVERRTARFELPIRPVRLAGLDVSVRRQCVDDPRDAAEFQVVWDEARKALEAALLAQRERLFRFNSLLFDREVTRRRLDLLQVETEAVERVVETPFQSLPAARLSEAGYIQTEGETTWYYAPDATVLLSDQFMAEHCFGLDRDERDGRRRIGVTFEPREDRDLPDISGVLWLDEATAELERVEFEYENLPYAGVRDDRIRGEVLYERLPGGAFIVRDWYIRMPNLALPEGDRRYVLLSFTEYGGQLREVYDAEGSPVAWLGGGVISGTIHDPLAGGPLQNATVVLDRPHGDDLEVHTGPRGEYLFYGLEPGKHEIMFHHPVTVTLDWEPPEEEVELAADEVLEVSFALPGPVQLRDRACGRDARGGVILGRVLEAETRLPYRGVDVEAEWDPLLAEGQGPSGQLERASDRTDLVGRFELCGIPLGVDVSIYLESSDGPAHGRRVRLERPAVIVDFDIVGR